MNKLKIIAGLIFVFGFVQVKAQTVFGFEGRVEDGTHVIAGATVNLLSAKDSSLVKAALTSDSGRFVIPQMASADYLIQVQAVGYKDYYSAPLSYKKGNQVEIPAIHLHTQEASLDAVVVSSRKPFIERKIDKTVVNVASTVAATGNTVWDLMDKLPGIIVDQNNNALNLAGKNGVQVYIDGKPTYLSADQLAARLKSMDASTIETVEIMTNPSAKYDAAGNAGIINIITKKAQTRGINGSFNANYGIGRYARTNEGLTLNYRSGKMNLYGNYNYYKGKNWNINNLERRFEDSTFSPQVANTTSRWQAHNFKAGIDYYLNEKDILGFSLQGNINPSTDEGTNTTRFLKAQQLLTTVVTDNHYDQKSTNMTYDLNYEHKFNKEGHSLSADLVYSKYSAGRNNQDFRIATYNPDGSLAEPTDLPNPLLRMGQLPSYIDIKTGKVDYARPLKGNAKMEAGIKSSYVSSDNDVHYYVFQNNAWENDSTATNHFKYTENINAAYLNFNKQFTHNWSLQLGLRGEQTVSNGHQYINDSIVKRNYFQLFPTVFVQKQIKDIHTFGLSYSRRIDRPNYQDLNPFMYFLDPYTYSVGNPFLRPQTSNNFELSYSYKSLIVSTFGYAHTSDVMSDLLKQVDSSLITYQTKDNMSSTDDWTLNVSLNWPVTKWFTSNTSMYGLRKSLSGVYLDERVNLHGYTFGFNSSNSFNLPKGYKMELSSIYHSPILWGLFNVRHQLQFNWGLQKSILKDMGTIKIGVNDIFRSNSNKVLVQYGNVNTLVYSKWDNRRFTVAFTYRFSKGLKIQSRDRASAIQEEQGRIKSN